MVLFFLLSRLLSSVLMKPFAVKISCRDKMDTASLPNVLIMCLTFSFYMNVYCLIRAGSVCDYGCFPYIAFSEEFHVFLGFSSTARMFVQ